MFDRKVCNLRRVKAGDWSARKFQLEPIGRRSCSAAPKMIWPPSFQLANAMMHLISSPFAFVDPSSLSEINYGCLSLKRKEVPKNPLGRGHFRRPRAKHRGPRSQVCDGEWPSAAIRSRRGQPNASHHPTFPLWPTLGQVGEG